MRSTPFNTRSSEWIGDMTVYLRETGEDNSLQLNDNLFTNKKWFSPKIIAQKANFVLNFLPGVLE